MRAHDLIAALVADKIQTLSPDLQRLLTTAVCLGRTRFDVGLAKELIRPLQKNDWTNDESDAKQDFDDKVGEEESLADPAISCNLLPIDWAFAWW